MTVLHEQAGYANSAQVPGWIPFCTNRIYRFISPIRSKKEKTMNKTELINAIAESAELTKADAGRALQGFMQVVTESLARGEKISLIGFGTFSVVNRAARNCQNPQTGKKMKIAAKKVVKFKVGKQLAETVR
jgi:DNA-binding protein HU-beta